MNLEFYLDKLERLAYGLLLEEGTAKIKSYATLKTLCQELLTCAPAYGLDSDRLSRRVEELVWSARILAGLSRGSGEDPGQLLGHCLGIIAALASEAGVSLRARAG